MLSLQKFPEKPFCTLHFNKVALNMKKKKFLELSLSLSLSLYSVGRKGNLPGTE